MLECYSSRQPELQTELSERRQVLPPVLECYSSRQPELQTALGSDVGQGRGCQLQREQRYGLRCCLVSALLDLYGNHNGLKRLGSVRCIVGSRKAEL